MSARDGFDLWMEGELRRRLDGIAAMPTPLRPRYAQVGRAARRRFRILSGASAAVAAKAGTGLVVAAFAMGATGTALSGSPNPVAWTSAMHQVVDQCKAGTSVEGIGGCVAAVAQEHGQPLAIGAPAVPPAATGSKPPSPAALLGQPGHEPSESPEAAEPGASSSPAKKANPSPKPSPAHRPAPNPSPKPSPTPDDEGGPSHHD